MENANQFSSDETFDEVSDRSNDIYRDRLKAEIEATHLNQFIAIHVDSGDYAVAKSTAKATRELLKRQPVNGRIYLRKIGDESEDGLAERLSAMLDQVTPENLHSEQDFGLAVGSESW